MARPKKLNLFAPKEKIDDVNQEKNNQASEPTPPQNQPIKEKKEKPDFCYNVKNWVSTINIDSLDEMFRDTPTMQIVEVGFLKKLPSKFYVTLPKEEGHSYQQGFDTIEEAREAVEKAIESQKKK